MKRILLPGFLMLAALNSFSQEWKELNTELVNLYKKGELEKAILVGEKALKATEKEFGKNSNNYASNLSNLATVYDKMGNHTKAEPLYIEVMNIRKKLLGEEHPSYANSLNKLALLYVDMGNYVKAEPLHTDAMNIRKKVLGKEHPDYANSLNYLALLYKNMGNYAKAETLCVEAMNIRKKVLGEEHPDYATSLNNLAVLYADMGNYAKAEPLHVEAMNIRKKVLKEEHPDYANSLSNLAVLYDKMGNYTKAEPLHIEAMNIRKKVLGEEHPSYANSLSNLATLYDYIGNYAKAEPLKVKAMNIYKRVLGEEHPDYATCLNNLAISYSEMGNYAKAEPLKMQAVNIYKRALGEEHPGYANSLNSLAFLYEDMGNYGKAELLYLEAMNIRKKALGEEHPSYASSLNNLAALYHRMGNYIKAELLYLEAMNIRKKALGEEHPYYAASLNNLALLYKDMGDNARVEVLCVEAMNIYKTLLGEEHPDYASSLNNLASLYNKMGDYARAELLFVKAMSIRKKALGEEHPDYANSLSNLAGLYTDMSNYAKAEPLHLEALNIHKRVLGEEHPSYAGILINLAALYVDMGNYVKAETPLLTGTGINLRHMLSNFTSLSEKEKQVWLDDNFYKNEWLLSFRNNYSGLSDSAKNFILSQQLLLKSLVLAETKGLLQAIQSTNDINLQQLYNDWLGIKKQISQQYALPVTKRNGNLNDWENQAESMEKQLGSQSSAFREQQKSIQVKAADIGKGLSDNEAALEFVCFKLYNKKWTDSIMYAVYIITANNTPVFVPLFEEKQLQKLFDSAGTTATSMVSKFYRGTELKSKSAATALGKELYNLIWAPLELHLKGIKKISYSPAGKLYSIAFHALPVDSTRILMDKYELNQYTSTRQVALRNNETPKEKVKSITLFGDAAFTLDSTTLARSKSNNQNTTNIYTPPGRGTRGGTWADLPGTAGEVKKVKQLFDQNKITTQLFTQTTATEENLKALSGNSPQVLHIATHGFFLPEPEKMRRENNLNNENTYTLANDPLLRSGLILSGGNHAWSGKTPIDGVEDGIATAYEIAQLNLSNTELVVLSACETALGDVKGSEGVFGLQRAFKMAGVKKMIVSLWQVPDKETAELMTAFYSYWMKGKTINESFSQAQADMRKKYSPFYWAAFVLVE